MFNAGDRVKRITSSGGHLHIPCGTVLIVRRGQMGGMVYVEGYEGGLFPSRFELVTPVDNRQEINIYVVLYTHPIFDGRIKTNSFMTEDEANQQADLFRRETNGYTLVALKKFKTRI